MTTNDRMPTPLTAPGLKFKDTVAHLIAASLQRHGIEIVFGQSLPSMLHLACEQLGLRQVAYRTENAGGYMADAHARMTGRPSVVTAQNGPAATLLVPALAEALKASVPIIALVQDVNRADTDRNAFQDLDHMQLFAGCTKWVRRVTEPSRVEDYIDQAFVAACSGRPGPVALMLPADLLTEPAPPARRFDNLGRFPLDRPCASRDSVRQAAELLAKARRPLVIAGGGVHLSGAHQALADLQESAHLPVATTVMGKGAVDEGHPLSIGVVGYFMGPHGATRHQRELVTQADVILLVGSRTNQNGTDSWKLYPRDARFIHVDADGCEVGRNYEALRLVGDARETLVQLRAELAALASSTRGAARPALEARIEAGRVAHRREVRELVASEQSPIRPERVMHELQKVLTPDSIVVSDASYSSVWTSNYLASRRAGMRFLTPRGLAGLGWGFPMAMGAKLAHPADEVFCVVGDGGFGHVWSELETATRSGIKVTLIVLNNGILGFQKHAENLKYGAHTSAVDFFPVDHAAIARACGCEGVRVTAAGEIGPALSHARAQKVTTLIDIICDADAFPPLTFFTPEAAAAA